MAGLVTLRTLLEEIVGEIDDENGPCAEVYVHTIGEGNLLSKGQWIWTISMIILMPNFWRTM